MTSFVALQGRHSGDTVRQLHGDMRIHRGGSLGRFYKNGESQHGRIHVESERLGDATKSRPDDCHKTPTRPQESSDNADSPRYLYELLSLFQLLRKWKQYFFLSKSRNSN